MLLTLRREVQILIGSIQKLRKQLTGVILFLLNLFFFFKQGLYFMSFCNFFGPEIPFLFFKLQALYDSLKINTQPFTTDSLRNCTSMSTAEPYSSTQGELDLCIISFQGLQWPRPTFTGFLGKLFQENSSLDLQSCIGITSKLLCQIYVSCAPQNLVLQQRQMSTSVHGT